MRAPHLAPVDAAALETYPLATEDRINNWFLRWEFGRWLNSEMYLEADPEVGYAYLNLIFVSQLQFPVGTLPTDRRLLAKLLKMDVDQFERLCRREPSPLRHWRPCVTDRGEVRLMHPTVLGTILEQTAERERRAAHNTAEAERKRLDRIVKAMAEAGFDLAVRTDEVLVKRIDQWMTDAIKGRRDKDAYDRAFLRAARQRWMAPPVARA